VCMYVYIYVCIYTCIRMCSVIHHIHTYTYIHIHTHAHTGPNRSLGATTTRMHICSYIHTYTCIYTYTRMCSVIHHMHTCTYIHIHTHAHTGPSCRMGATTARIQREQAQLQCAQEGRKHTPEAQISFFRDVFHVCMYDMLPYMAYPHCGGTLRKGQTKRRECGRANERNSEGTESEFALQQITATKTQEARCTQLVECLDGLYARACAPKSVRETSHTRTYTHTKTTWLESLARTCSTQSHRACMHV
jgi:hypothetical protein